MKATLSLEFIGADTYQWFRSMTKMYNGLAPGLGDYMIGGPSKGSKPWVAEITGKDEKFKLSRTFMKPNWDYKNANSKGSRGVMLWFILESDKLYEVNARVSWKNSDRYFCTVNTDGNIYYLNDDEVKEWLSAL